MERGTLLGRLNWQIGEVAWPVEQRPLTFICGLTPLVETIAASLVELGHEPARIKTERFGLTGER